MYITKYERSYCKIYSTMKRAIKREQETCTIWVQSTERKKEWSREKKKQEQEQRGKKINRKRVTFLNGGLEEGNRLANVLFDDRFTERALCRHRPVELELEPRMYRQILAPTLDPW